MEVYIRKVKKINNCLLHFFHGQNIKFRFRFSISWIFIDFPFNFLQRLLLPTPPDFVLVLRSCRTIASFIFPQKMEFVHNICHLLSKQHIYLVILLLFFFSLIFSQLFTSHMSSITAGHQSRCSSNIEF